MNSTTSKTRKTVRMFDGETWDTYKVGSKKHRAAEARRAAFDARKDAVKAANRAQAAWMREHGVVPKGTAWTLANAGERDIAVLKAANTEDGLKPAGSKAAKDAIAAAVAKTTSKSAPKAEKAAKKASKKGGKKAKAPKLTAAEIAHAKRVEAGRKGWETRVANGTAVKDPATGRFVAVKPQVEVVEPEVADAAEEARTSPKALFWADLSDAGLSDAEIKAAWKIRKRALATA